MATKSQRPKELEHALSSFNTAVEAVDRAEKTTTIPPVKAAFFSAKDLLAAIRVGSLSARIGRLLTDDVRRIR